MALERGFRLDHYEIVEIIGKGGMGEVYSATDTHLPRAVAIMVSKGGGNRPIWRPDGKELFYVGPASQVMAVDIDASKGFQAGTPQRMFTGPTTTTVGLGPVAGRQALSVRRPAQHRPCHPVYGGPQLGDGAEEVEGLEQATRSPAPRYFGAAALLAATADSG